MNHQTLIKIFAELEPELTGQKFGKVFSLSRYRFAIDFRLPDSKYLFLSVEPTSPRIYLIKRRFADLEAQSKNPSGFTQYLRTRLSNGVLVKLEKLKNDRILKFLFSTRNDVGQVENYRLIAQFTGRSANLYLTTESELILDSLRENKGERQQTGEIYRPPERTGNGHDPQDREPFPIGEFESISAALDSFYTEREFDQTFRNAAKTARARIKKEITKQKQLSKNLESDLKNHGDPDKWKRFGDLLLANLATAERENGLVSLIDYFDDSTPRIQIEIEENDSISEAAEKFFKRYTKARNAREQITKRLAAVRTEVSAIELQKERIDTAVKDQDLSYLQNLAADDSNPKRTDKKQPAEFSGARKFLSSDGAEILVGKRAKDNDFLTFRVAKSLDYWFHAADYPGSHVVVRNPTRGEISQTALVEAAQIAAFYSQAKSQAKVAVHYTQKKFVNKPKGAAPGLVSLANFKTILVEPGFPKN